jgi:hypothetical protein
MSLHTRTVLVCLSFALSSFAYAAGCTQATLTSITPFAVGKNAIGIAVGDVDNDGNLDFITADAFTGSVFVHRGNGDMTFDAKLEYATGRTHTTNPVSGDFNEDGWIDVGVQTGGGANDEPYAVVILLNQQNGTLVAQPPIAVGYSARETYVADVNDDGHLDIYLPGMTPPVLRGVGNGTFIDGVAGFNGEASAPGDFDSDGKTDIAELAEEYESNPFRQVDSLLNIALRQNANPEYTLAQTLTVTPASGVMTAGDFNGDGAPDLATAHWTNERVFLFMNDGTGQFTKTERIVNQDATRILAVDVNEDGLHDLVIASANGGGLQTMLSNGDGTFGDAEIQSYGWHNVYGLAAGDFNNDGRPDFIAIHGGGDDANPAKALPMRNDCTAIYAAVTVTSSPNPGAYGATATLVARVTPREPGTAPTGTVTFYAGTRLLGTSTLTTLSTESVASLDVANLPPGGNAIRAVYSGDATYPVAYSETHKHIVQRPAFRTPTALAATALPNGTVKLTWVGGTNTTWYIVERGGTGGARMRLTETQAPEWFIDETPVANHVNIYYVAARHEGDLLPTGFSAPDIAYAGASATIDRGDRLFASDVVRLRAMVTSLTRLTTLPAPTFSDASVTGMRPKPLHVTQLRSAINTARANLGLPAISWSTNPTSGGPVRATDFEQVRQACD